MGQLGWNLCLTGPLVSQHTELRCTNATLGHGSWGDLPEMTGSTAQRVQEEADPLLEEG